MDQQGAENNNNQKKIQLALENGKVIISGTAEDESKGALIKPGTGVQAFLNGRLIGVGAEIFPGDKVEIVPAEEVREEWVEVKISSDELRAEARYIPGLKKYHLIEDAQPTDNLVVEGVPKEETITSFSVDDILNLLKEQRITYGVDPDAPGELLAEKEKWQLVAEGEPVQQGTDGWVEPLFEGGVKTVTYNEDESRVDYRKRYEIDQVNENDTIARIHQPQPGKPGRTVTGQELQPDPVKKAEIECGNGAKLSEDQDTVIATRKGVPFHKKGRVHSLKVENIYTHKGDVDIKSGNIDFRGHFKIQGAVNEGMKVSADGNIEIGDNASGAEILAGGSVVFKANCIKCKVQAGWVDLALNNIYKTLDQMEESIDKALVASEEVAKALEAKGKYSEQMEAAVVRALLQSKFTELPEYSNNLKKTLQEVGKSLPEELLQTVNKIVPFFTDYQYSQTLGRPMLSEVKSLLGSLQGKREYRTEKADITVPYVQNSALFCTGNIIIPGQGAYNSQMKCSGEVNISRLFRGGTIEAGENVYIGEAGTPRITADQGLIQVPYSGKVHLGAAYENIRVRFGKNEYRCEENLNNVMLYLDQEEYEVKLSSWKK